MIFVMPTYAVRWSPGLGLDMITLRVPKNELKAVVDVLLFNAATNIVIDLEENRTNDLAKTIGGTTASGDHTFSGQLT